MKRLGLLLTFALLVLFCANAVCANSSEWEKSRTYVGQKFIGVLIDQLGVESDQLSPETDLRRDLGADDLDIIELVMALEESFDIIIADDQVAEISTIESAVDLIYGIEN